MRHLDIGPRTSLRSVLGARRSATSDHACRLNCQSTTRHAIKLYDLSGTFAALLRTFEVRLALEDVGVLGGRDGLVGHHRGELLELGVRVDVLEADELPGGAGGLLVLAALALLVLNARLLPAGRLVVAGADAVRDLLPQPPRLPLALLVDRLDRDLLLGRARVVEHGALSRADVRDARPLALVRLDLLAVLRQLSLERVRLAREVALALVLDVRSVAGRALDGARLGKLDVGRAPDDAVDTQLGERDQVRLLGVTVLGLDSEKSVTRLLD